MMYLLVLGHEFIMFYDFLQLVENVLLSPFGGVPYDVENTFHTDKF